MLSVWGRKEGCHIIIHKVNISLSSILVILLKMRFDIGSKDVGKTDKPGPQKGTIPDEFKLIKRELRQQSNGNRLLDIDKISKTSGNDNLSRSFMVSPTSLRR